MVWADTNEQDAIKLRTKMIHHKTVVYCTVIQCDDMNDETEKISVMQK